MAEIESLIRIFAITMGIITIAAPAFSVFRQARRSTGRTSGTGKSLRTWPGVLLLTIGFVAMGIVLWKQLPIQLSDKCRLLLLVSGAFIYFPGVSLYLWSLITIRSQFGVSGLLGADLYKEHQLIARGPYGIIRHPMYMGILLAAIGGLLIFRTWAMVVFLPMALMVTTRAGREEKLLEKEFGNEWQEYISKVPRWFPKL